MDIGEEINDRFVDLVQTKQEKTKPLVINDDEEVFLLEAPKSIDLKKLKGANFKIGSKSCKISSETANFKGIVLPEKTTILLADAGKLKQVPVEGLIRMKPSKMET